MTPDDTNLSPSAQSSPTRVDNVAEKILAVIGPAIEGEDTFDVLAALDFIKSRISHIANEQMDADQLQ
jgi:hypothetical protein